MHVSLSTLESALRFVDDLADTDDPAELGRRALPGLYRLVHADVLSYNEIGPEPGQVSYCAYPEDVVFSPDSAGSRYTILGDAAKSAITKAPARPSCAPTPPGIT